MCVCVRVRVCGVWNVSADSHSHPEKGGEGDEGEIY